MKCDINWLVTTDWLNVFALQWGTAACHTLQTQTNHYSVNDLGPREHVQCCPFHVFLLINAFFARRDAKRFSALMTFSMKWFSFNIFRTWTRCNCTIAICSHLCCGLPYAPTIGALHKCSRRVRRHSNSSSSFSLRQKIIIIIFFGSNGTLAAAESDCSKLSCVIGAFASFSLFSRPSCLHALRVQAGARKPNSENRFETHVSDQHVSGAGTNAARPQIALIPSMRA